jgi:hypothetical protein
MRVLFLVLAVTNVADSPFGVPLVPTVRGSDERAAAFTALAGSIADACIPSGLPTTG